MRFRVSATPEAHACRFILTGDVDMDAVADVVELGTTALTDRSITALVMDLSAVTFMDSAGLGALIRLRTTAGDLDKPMTLEHIPPRVHKLLDITGLNERFGVTTETFGSELADA